MTIAVDLGRKGTKQTNKPLEFGSIYSRSPRAWKSARFLQFSLILVKSCVSSPKLVQFTGFSHENE